MTEKRSYKHIARLYDLLDLPFENRRYRPLRQVLFAGVSGKILDAGVGTGRNMPFYPPHSEVFGIDLSPAMLARAHKRKCKLNIAVELSEMDAIVTEFPDDHFDNIIATFLFCVLDDADQLPALRELARIVKPTGRIRIIEYAYSHKVLKRFVMRLWAPWVHFAYGASFNRNTERYVDDAGLELIEQRFLFKDIIKLLVLKPK